MKKLIIFLLCVSLLVIIFIKVDISKEEIERSNNLEQQNINFVKTGNVVFNNPGMEEGVWYLIYDEPGSPANNIKLFFENSQSINIGDRLTIEGFLDGDRVIVKRIVDSSVDF